MATENHHYHYQALDDLLVELYDPKEIGNRLDEIMNALTVYASRDEDYREVQEDHHTILKMLRDIFWWKLPKIHNH